MKGGVPERDAKEIVERVRAIIATETGLSRYDKQLKKMVYVYHHPGSKFPLVAIKSDVNGNVWQGTNRKEAAKMTDRIMQRIADELGCKFGFYDDWEKLPKDSRTPFYVMVWSL